MTFEKPIKNKNPEKTFEEDYPSLSKACLVGTIGETLLKADKEEIQKHCLDKGKVLREIQIALPYCAVGGNCPSEKTMKLIKNIRHYLYEQLGFIKELEEEGL